MNNDAVEGTPKDWSFRDNWKLTANRVVDRGNDEGDEEVEEQAERGGSFSSLERGGSQNAAGYPLPEPFEGHTLQRHDSRGCGYVRNSGQCTCESDCLDAIRWIHEQDYAG